MTVVVPARSWDRCLRVTYEVPHGWVGRVGDSVAGRKLAHRVRCDHMGRVAARTSRFPADFVDASPSENFIG